VAVAHRMYARALFQAAREEGVLEEVASEQRMLAAAMRESPQLQSFLRNPQIDPPDKAAVLEQLVEGASHLTRNFVRLVAQKGRAGELAEMSDELDALVDREQGRLAVELTTAYALSDEEASSIVERIEQASGRKVEASRSVDPSLVGGLVLQIGSFRADGSVRGRLERLRQELSTAH